MPYLEERTLQSMLDFTQPAFSGTTYANLYANPQFASAFATQVATFLCPSDPAPVLNTETGTALNYAGINYMVSMGSGTGILNDIRFPTDGITYYNSAVSLRKVTDGLSNTVFMSESIRSIGADYTATSTNPAPTFPYQYTLNGSTGLTPGNGPGITMTGSPWTGPTINGMIASPNLQPIWQSFPPGAERAATALRGRGAIWAAAGAVCTLTNGYTTPNTQFPTSSPTSPAILARGAGTLAVQTCSWATARCSSFPTTSTPRCRRGLHSINGGEVVSDFTERL